MRAQGAFLPSWAQRWAFVQLGAELESGGPQGRDGETENQDDGKHAPPTPARLMLFVSLMLEGAAKAWGGGLGDQGEALPQPCPPPLLQEALQGTRDWVSVCYFILLL